MMIDALIKLVNASPTKKSRLYNYSDLNLQYLPENQIHWFRKQEFDIWIDYVKSSLQVLYDYSNLEVIALAKAKIEKIAYTEQHDSAIYFQYSLQIESILLNLAEDILKYG